MSTIPPILSQIGLENKRDTFEKQWHTEKIYDTIRTKEKFMTEKEKMLAGKLYRLSDGPELLEELANAKDKCFAYNQLLPSKKEERKQILQELLGKVGEHFTIEQPFHCDYGKQITIGENFYANYNLTILDVNTVTFGECVLIGPNCSFYTAEHPLDPALRKEGWESGRPIKVGDNVWFGGNVTVLPGVTIGDNAVIGAGSVVTKDIPADCIAVGNPCRVMRKR